MSDPASEAWDGGAHRRLALIFYALALASGAAALIYELTWSRMLSLTFGSSTLAAAAVIAAFMGGMGLGARFYQFLYRRVPKPILVYAGLELGIALTTALLTRTFYALPELFANVWRGLGDGAMLGALRFVVVFLLLLLPSMMMGATFPALCTVVIRSAKGLDRHLGWIYGINTLGGAGGVLLAGLYLIERFGLSSTVLVANALNVTIGLVALLLVRSPSGELANRPLATPETAIPTRLPRWVTGVVLFGSGFATLGYEIVWFRALRYMVGNSTYALTTVLFVFLLGLGFGSLLLRPIVRRGTPEAALVWCQCLIAVLAVGAMAVEMTVLSQPALRDSISIYSPEVLAQPWWWRVLVAGAIAVAVMLPATLIMGLSFPLASRLYLGDLKKLGSEVGAAYLFANVGSILGAILGAVLFLPVFGTIGGTKAIAFFNLALALLVAMRLAGGVRRAAVPLTGGLVLVLVASFLLPGSLVLRGEKVGREAGELLFVEEGDISTVQVLAEKGRPDRLVMTVDGYKIGWSAGFVGSRYFRKQVLLAHMPMVFDGRIRHTLNVGLGSASTLKSLATYPEVETLDCVEISASVRHAADLFPESSVFDDPRVNVVVDDAVHYLLRSSKKYDVIISDGKQHPFFAGNAALLCREFLQLAADDLSEEGMFIQWNPLGTLHADLRIILRTACEVFPYVEVYFYPRDAVMVVGSHRPLAGRPGLAADRYAALPVAEELRHCLIGDADGLRARWVCGRAQLMTLLADERVSTWDDLILDFSTFRTAPENLERSSAENLELLLEAARVPLPPSERHVDPVPDAYRHAARLAREAWLEVEHRRFPEAAELARQAAEANPADLAVQGLQGFLRERSGARPRPESD